MGSLEQTAARCKKSAFLSNAQQYGWPQIYGVHLLKPENNRRLQHDLQQSTSRAVSRMQKRNHFNISLAFRLELLQI